MRSNPTFQTHFSERYSLETGRHPHSKAWLAPVRDDIVAALKNSGNDEGLAPVAPIVVCVA